MHGCVQQYGWNLDMHMYQLAHLYSIIAGCDVWVGWVAVADATCPRAGNRMLPNTSRITGVHAKTQNHPANLGGASHWFAIQIGHVHVACRLLPQHALMVRPYVRRLECCMVIIRCAQRLYGCAVHAA